MTFIENYINNYKTLLDPNVSGAKRGLAEGLYRRGSGFELMFKLLLEQKPSNFYIVETGTWRNPGNWKDGQSAMLFSEFVSFYGGKTKSVDIDPVACETAQKNLNKNLCQVYCSDSVKWLSNLKDIHKVDLFYLDSYDVKWKNDTPSAEHHLKEFKAIESFLKPGCIVAIDDNAVKLNSLQRTGKGRMIVEYLDSKGVKPIYDAYQIIYKF